MAVPEKYTYLADNAAKRDQSKSRKPKAAAVREAHRRAKAQKKAKSMRRQQEIDDAAMDQDDQDGAPDGDRGEGTSKDGGMDEDEDEM
jgi:hypothetical protein